MNKLDEKIVHTMLTHDNKCMCEILQEFSFKISKGIGTLSEISRPFYVAVLRQYINAFSADMGEAESEIAEKLHKILNENSTYIKMQVPSNKEE